MALRVGDWMKLNCGDKVFDISEDVDLSWEMPRHVGRLEAILHGAVGRVTWLETGHTSYLPIGEIRRVPRGTW
jgi:hypothetical protein